MLRETPSHLFFFFGKLKKERFIKMLLVFLFNRKLLYKFHWRTEKNRKESNHFKIDAILESTSCQLRKWDPSASNAAV